MHVLVGIAVVVGFIAFAFGVRTAQRFVAAVLFMTLLAIAAFCADVLYSAIVYKDDGEVWNGIRTARVSLMTPEQFAEYERCIARGVHIRTCWGG